MTTTTRKYPSLSPKGEFWIEITYPEWLDASSYPERYTEEVKMITFMGEIPNSKFIRPGDEMLVRLTRDTTVDTVVTEMHGVTRWVSRGGPMRDDGLPFDMERFIGEVEAHPAPPS